MYIITCNKYQLISFTVHKLGHRSFHFYSRRYTTTPHLDTFRYNKMAHQARADAEAQVKRNPHPDFKKVEGSRPDFEAREVTFTKLEAWKWCQ
jgi:hypothetical protein